MLDENEKMNYTLFVSDALVNETPENNIIVIDFPDDLDENFTLPENAKQVAIMSGGVAYKAFISEYAFGHVLTSSNYKIIDNKNCRKNASILEINNPRYLIKQLDENTVSLIRYLMPEDEVYTTKEELEKELKLLAEQFRQVENIKGPVKRLLAKRYK